MQINLGVNGAIALIESAKFASKARSDKWPESVLKNVKVKSDGYTKNGSLVSNSLRICASDGFKLVSFLIYCGGLSDVDGQVDLSVLDKVINSKKMKPSGCTYCSSTKTFIVSFEKIKGRGFEAITIPLLDEGALADELKYPDKIFEHLISLPDRPSLPGSKPYNNFHTNIKVMYDIFNFLRNDIDNFLIFDTRFPNDVHNKKNLMPVFLRNHDRNSVGIDFTIPVQTQSGYFEPDINESLVCLNLSDFQACLNSIKAINNQVSLTFSMSGKNPAYLDVTHENVQVRYILVQKS